MTLKSNEKSPQKNIEQGVDLDQADLNYRHRILVIDDEADTVMLLKQVLLRDGYDVSGATSGKEALEKINQIKPSLVLLDLMMPDMDGWETFQRIQQTHEVPVIVISALSQSQYVVKALEMGADDYISKPFDHAEVKARVNAVLRRAGKPRVMNRMAFPDAQLLKIDLDTQEITYYGARVQLTGKMFEVFAFLAKKAPHVVSYDEILNGIWGENNVSARNRLKYLIYLLRNEFTPIEASREIIENVDRLGYRLCTG